MTTYKIHHQYDSDPRRNGKLRLIRRHTGDGASEVIAADIRPEYANTLCAAFEMREALAEMIDMATHHAMPEAERRAVLRRARKVSAKAHGEG